MPKFGWLTIVRVSAGAILLLSASRALAEVRYVDKSVVGGANNGIGWNNAFVELRDALAAAAGNPAITEIWIADGVYTPTAGTSRTVSFQLRNNLIVRGGFAGGETSITQRRPADHRVILSGDIGALGVAGDNSHHVLTCANVNATAILETVVITLGNADGSAAAPRGGGALITGANTSPMLINCLFVGNSANSHGGAVYVSDAAPILVNCVFTGNSSGGNGGAAFALRGASRFINCTFANNTASGMGGGFFTTEQVGANCFTNPALVNCIFWGNLDPGPADQSRQIDRDSFICPPELGAERAANEPFSVTYSIIQANNGSLGPTNSGVDPLLLDVDGTDNLLGTPDDNVRLPQNSPAINFGDEAALPVDSADLDADGNTAEPVARDADLLPRLDSGGVDAGAYEFPLDCNDNGVFDLLDIIGGTSQDCNGNDTPDECEDGEDCDVNGVLDECQLAGNDCNVNGVPDGCDITAGTAEDCDGNAIPDECDLAAHDCNGNEVIDACDILFGTSGDCNLNATPDECEPSSGDCNANSIDDSCDIAAGTSRDCQGNMIPDECELAGNDCDANGVPDDCDTDCDNTGIPDACENFTDCNSNGVADACDIAFGGRPDFNQNGVPDECDPDCNGNGYPDFIDLAFHLSEDCNDDDIPDDCQLAGNDCNANEVPDDCEGLIAGDTDGDGDIDLADHARLHSCLIGPVCDSDPCAVPAYAAGCCASDRDGDGDVDLHDFSAWMRAFP